jgi:acyl carrier protein
VGLLDSPQQVLRLFAPHKILGTWSWGRGKGCWALGLRLFTIRAELQIHAELALPSDGDIALAGGSVSEISASPDELKTFACSRLGIWITLTTTLGKASETMVEQPDEDIAVDVGGFAYANARERVRALFAKALELTVDEIADHKLFYDDLGGDSLQKLELAVDLERAFGVKFSDEQITSMSTVSDVMAELKQRTVTK